MSVLACCRKDCDNVMCDHLSREHGYICRECLDELKARGRTDIELFMNTPKGHLPERNKNWEREVDREFPDVGCRYWE